MFIYILELLNNKYYVGKTVNVKHRFMQHCNGQGSEWTTLHKPKRVIQTIPCNDPMAEDVYTKRYMIKYGVNNVRGGSYSQIILYDWQIKSLENEFKSTKNSCFKCGLLGHYANACTKTTTRVVQRLNSGLDSTIKHTIASLNETAAADACLEKKPTVSDSTQCGVRNISSHSYIEEENKLEKESNIINTNLNVSITMYNGRYRQLTVNGNNYVFGVLIPYILNRYSERMYGFMYSTGQTNKLYTYEIKQHLRTVIKNKEHMIEMFNKDMTVSFGLDNYNINMDKIYTFIFGEEPPQTARYVICDHGLRCPGCSGSDVCPGYNIEILYVDDYGIVYNDYTEIYEKCKGKYNYKYHKTGKYI